MAVLALIGFVIVSNAVSPVDSTSLSLMANPVRKVVTMMQRMQAQIEKEGEEKEKMFEKFMCYCKNGGKDLGADVSAAEEKIPQLESSIKEGKGSKAQLEGDLKAAKADRTETGATLAKANAIREKEAKANAAETAETKANIDAVGKAIKELSAGGGAAFLQSHTRITEKLRQLSVSMDMEAVDRDLLAAFLSDGSTSHGSGEILGIMQQMHEEMKKDLATLVSDEDAAVKAHESLVSSKQKERLALTKAIETKTVRVGELAVALAQDQDDLEDTAEGLAENKKMLANLGTDCKTKTGEWEEYKKTMSGELVALADTIKLLNDDDALDLFKKTLPSPASSFMQVAVTAKSMKKRALHVLKAARKGHHHKDPRLDFLEMALHGGQMGFDKIIEMVDGLMTVLKKEQSDDDNKKAYCLAEFDKYEDIKKGVATDISDLEKAVADGEETMKALAKDIATLSQGIKDLDTSVAEATEQRKKENADSVKTLAQNGASKELLEMAKNRLNKFYNPKLYDAGDPALAQTDDDSAPSFVQVKSHRQAPSMDFKKKDEESNGVIAMLNILIGDVTHDSQLIDLEEKEAQKEYEQFMADAKTKRSLDAKTITDKEGAQAAAEASLETNKQAMKEKKVEMAETEKYIMGLHQECDWLLKFYKTRKEARSDEVDSLDKAKAVLNGADYSFLQTSSVHLRGSK